MNLCHTYCYCDVIGENSSARSTVGRSVAICLLAEWSCAAFTFTISCSSDLPSSLVWRKWIKKECSKEYHKIDRHYINSKLT